MTREITINGVQLKKVTSIKLDAESGMLSIKMYWDERKKEHTDIEQLHYLIRQQELNDLGTGILTLFVPMHHIKNISLLTAHL